MLTQCVLFLALYWLLAKALKANLFQPFSEPFVGTRGKNHRLDNFLPQGVGEKAIFYNSLLSSYNMKITFNKLLKPVLPTPTFIFLAFRASSPKLLKKCKSVNTLVFWLGTILPMNGRPVSNDDRRVFVVIIGLTNLNSLNNKIITKEVSFRMIYEYGSQWTVMGDMLIGHKI